MSGTVRSAVVALLGAEGVIPAQETAQWAVGGATPLAVVRPSSAEEVSQVLAVAAAEGVGVVPLGGRTDPGSEAPTGPFLVMSTERLGGIVDYEPADLTVTAGAGMSLGDLGAVLAAQGQWLPADPPFAPRWTLGGLVATGAAGPLGTAYGAPRDHVLGLTVVSGDGRVLRLGGRVMKNVAGFDLVKLMVGSRGTLGVVVSASLRLFPRPEQDRLLVCSAESPAELLSTAAAVATASVVPASAVLLAGGPEGDATLVVRLHGAAATVSADEVRLCPGGKIFRRVPPEETAALLERTRDHAAAHTLVVRASALPGHLPELLGAVTSALPTGEVAADVLAGRVRCGVPGAEELPVKTLTTLRARVEGLRGSLTLERASAAILGQVPAYGSAGRAGALEAALRARFDPGGVLSPGRFAP